MIQLHETITVSTPIDRAYAYTADFSNVEHWDPGVARSRRRGEGPPVVGARFDLEVVFGGRTLPMTYTITELEPPHRLVLVGEGSTLRAVDQIEFAETDGGTLVTYTADLDFRGLVRLAVPFLVKRLEGVGAEAVAGLGAALEKL